MGKSPYPKELREEIVELACGGETSVAQLAKDFGIASATIYKWIEKADADDGGVSPASAGSSDADLRTAKNRIRTLEQENEVLRRATAYFSQAVLPK